MDLHAHVLGKMYALRSIHIYTHTHVRTFLAAVAPPSTNRDALPSALHIHGHTHAHTYTHKRMDTHTHTHIYVWTHILTHTHRDTHTHTHTHINVWTHIHTYTHTSLAHVVISIVIRTQTMSPMQPYPEERNHSYYGIQEKF